MTADFRWVPRLRKRICWGRLVRFQTATGLFTPDTSTNGTNPESVIRMVWPRAYCRLPPAITWATVGGVGEAVVGVPPVWLLAGSDAVHAVRSAAVMSTPASPCALRHIV